MDRTSQKVEELGSIISTADMESEAECLSLGVTEDVLSGHTMQITNIERSVCDAVKYRNKIDLDVCAEIMQTYLRKEGRDLSFLTEYAKQPRVWSTLKNHLEIALE